MQIPDKLDNIDLSVSTELENLFTYSIIPIIILIALIILLIIVIILISKKKAKTNIIEEKVINKADIKTSYLDLLEKLLKDIKDEKISNRKAYQALSKLIRNYIYEMTKIKVQNYTLQDISKEEMPTLYELVSEYYDPEFANTSKGNILSSIEKTKEVIKKWN